MNSHESTYPPLDRAAFLIEHACVPGFAPPYCAEAGQFFAAMEFYMARKQDSGRNEDVSE